MFLNCNYPNEFKMPKGRPKEVHPRRVSLELRQRGVHMIILKNGNVYFNENSYYFGIELPRFLQRNLFGEVHVVSTKNAINLTLLEWCGDTLSNAQEDLLVKYLSILR